MVKVVQYGYYAFVSLLVMVIMTGCAIYITSPIQLWLQSGEMVYEAAIAVNPNGVKYSIRTVRTSGAFEPDLMVLNITANGEFGHNIFWGYNGETYFHPDIAITDDGAAYMIWVAKTSTGLHYFSGVYTLDSGFDRTYLGDSCDQCSNPVIASNGDTVYAVFEIPDGTLGGTALRYKKIAGTPSAEGYVTNHPGDNIRRTAPAIVVDKDNQLHVTWLLDYGSTYKSVVYINNCNQSGDLTNPAALYSGILSAPDITATTHGTEKLVFIAYFNYQPDPTPQIEVFYCKGSPECTLSSRKEYSFTLGENWELDGKPSITAFIDIATIAFAAHNDSMGDSVHEIFRLDYDYFPEPGSFTRTQITNTGELNLKPRIVTLPYDATTRFQIISWWHTADFNLWNVKTYDTYNQFFRPMEAVHTMQTGCPWKSYHTGLDLAANHTWAGGIWLCTQTGGENVAAWIAFNQERFFLAVIQR